MCTRSYLLAVVLLSCVIPCVNALIEDGVLVSMLSRILQSICVGESVVSLHNPVNIRACLSGTFTRIPMFVTPLSIICLVVGIVTCCTLHSEAP